jgi:RNA processing factor Prp31
MTEEINTETAETPTDAPVQENVIARSPQATKQSVGITSGDKIAAPFGLAMTREGKPSDAPAKENVIARSEATRQSNTTAPENKPDNKLAELESALNETKQSLAARTGDYDRLKAALDDTVSAYRKLAVSSSPLYSDDIISGSTVEEIDASIKKVNGLVKKMRSTLEAELKDLTIPAGAPERSGPDLSGLSPRDKIKYGIQDKNK